MNFFKQAQDFAASANVNKDDGNNAQPDAPAEGGFGGLLSSASGFLSKAQQGSPAEDTSAAPPTLPGGRTAPTNSELLQSSQLLFGAARGEKVDSSQLAGAASDILGGLAAHGNLDKTAYGSYINQAEDYLEKYSGQGAGAGAAGPAGAGPAVDAPPAQAESDAAPAAPQAPPVNDDSAVPAQRPAPPADQSVAPPADVTADPASELRAARPSPTATPDQY